MLHILSNILFSGVVIGLAISLALLGIAVGRLDMSAFMTIFGCLVAYVVVLNMMELAKNIEAAIPAEEDEPPHI